MELAMTLEDIKCLSDSELMSLLKQNGANVGPLTGTTRPLFEKKLFRIINKAILEAEAIKEDASKESVDINNVTDNKLETGTTLEYKTEAAKVEATGDRVEPNNVSAPLVYFSVQIPLDSRKEEESFIFVDRKEALQMVKKYPGSRFKLFHKKEDARKYSLQAPYTFPSSPKPDATVFKDNQKPASDSSNFRGPKPPELSQFRRNIESGDLVKIKEKIWTNPRYLISSGDTPTVLQENFRYNALHACAVRNQPRAAELILDTLQDEAFLTLMYPDDTNTTRQARITFLTDLYLNMPDKGMNETPLHFACKFGHHEVVKVLTSQLLTDKCRTNKYGDTPKSVTCQRMRIGAGNTKQIIHSYLEEQCYVPLLRAVDETVPACVVEPMSSQTLASVLQSEVNSPHHSPRAVKALAGPMSPVQADKFRKTWTTPPSPSVKDKKRYVEIRRSDCNKGLERIGRALAHDLDITWSEYWEFLGTFTDLSTRQGLNQFEEHLKEKYDELSKELMLKSDLNVMDNLFSNLTLDLDVPSPRIGLNTPQTASSGTDSVFRPKAGATVVRDLASIFAGKTLNKSESCEKTDNSSLQNGSQSKNELFESSDLIEHIIVSSDKSGSELDELSEMCGSLSIKKNYTMSNSESEKENKNPTQTEYDSSNQHIFLEQNLDSDTLIDRDNSEELQNLDIVNMKVYDRQQSDGAETYHTALDTHSEPPSDASDLDDFEDCFDSLNGTGDGTCLRPDRLYIYGKEPCKTDTDVLRALGDTPVSPLQHPHVFQWKNSVQAVSAHTRHGWSTTPSRSRDPRAGTPSRMRHPHTLQSTSSPSLSRATLLVDEDEPISFTVRQSPDSDSSLSSHDESLHSIRTNLISDFFLQQ